MKKLTKRELETAFRAAKAANHPHATWRDVLKAKDGETIPPDVEARFDGTAEYFKNFVPPGDACICCGKRWPSNELSGWLGVAETSLEWGFANGEAFCRVCRWPSRVYHRNVKGADGVVEIKFLSCGLQYHPDGMTWRTDKQENEVHA
jgi:hypothetical protein